MADLDVGVQGVHDPEASMRLNRPGGPSIVISASGMVSGGRVLHHLAHQLPDRRNTVLLTGYRPTAPGGGSWRRGHER